MRAAQPEPGNISAANNDAAGSTSKRRLLIAVVAGNVFAAAMLAVAWLFGFTAALKALAVTLILAVAANIPMPRRTRTKPRPVFDAKPPEQDVDLAGRACIATVRRLAEEKAYLEHVEAERASRSEPGFGRTAEERIIWNELLDLELQNVDEQVNRALQQPGGISGSGAAGPMNSP